MPSLPPTSAQRAGLQRHHAAQSGSFYGEIIFRTRSVHAAITRRAGEVMLEDGGRRDASSLIIRIAKSHFTLPPREKETLQAIGETWIISSVAGKLAWEQEWVLTVGK